MKIISLKVLKSQLKKKQTKLIKLKNKNRNYLILISKNLLLIK